MSKTRETKGQKVVEIKYVETLNFGHEIAIDIYKFKSNVDVIFILSAINFFHPRYTHKCGI